MIRTRRLTDVVLNGHYEPGFLLGKLSSTEQGQSVRLFFPQQHSFGVLFLGGGANGAPQAYGSSRGHPPTGPSGVGQGPNGAPRAGVLVRTFSCKQTWFMPSLGKSTFPQSNPHWPNPAPYTLTEPAQGTPWKHKPRTKAKARATRWDLSFRPPHPRCTCTPRPRLCLPSSAPAPALHLHPRLRRHPAGCP